MCASPAELEICQLGIILFISFIYTGNPSIQQEMPVFRSRPNPVFGSMFNHITCSIIVYCDASVKNPQMYNSGY